ncbi:interferon-induced protein 44-like [Crassostrea angulata]|uniref:interferon-induced protein 44-like n=1 Tax=Magallana angulata TaxID=2784310 RepID=UPI0022B1D235|nr:interferon-induced protein 44-like [Crassostrea angulata]
MKFVVIKTKVGLLEKFAELQRTDNIFETDRDKLQLSSWFGKECHFKLLYKISRDGGSPQTFHNLCDNKGPTVTIFYNTDNNVYGGYLSDSWRNGPAEPWREPPVWKSKTLDSLKEFIRSFQPKEELNVPEVNILLVGQVGAGKSSVVNTINSVWKGEISSRSWAGSSEHSLTTSFTKFRISDPSTGTYLKFRLCDMRGLEETMDVKSEDIAFLLDGNLPNKYKFNPAARATKDTPGFIKEPTMKDMIHTVVFVIDGSNVEVMPDGIIKKLKDIKEMLIERDVPLLVLVTKIDKVCSDVDKDVEEVFFSNAVKKTVDKVSDIIAIPRSHVLPVKNYEKERTLQNNICILAMEALKQALLFCQDFLENQS